MIISLKFSANSILILKLAYAGILEDTRGTCMCCVLIALPGICDEREDAVVEEHDGENQQPVS